MIKACSDPLVFSTELRPSRSATRQTVTWFTICAAAVMFPVALIFGLIGAWPMFGFMGLKLVALISLLLHHHRKTTIVERIAVTDHQLHLERVSPWGRREIWSCLRRWVRVRLVNSGKSDSRLEFLSHGNSISFGKFLTADERREVEAPLRRFVVNICAQTRPSPV